jgi:hypothetical protein
MTKLTKALWGAMARVVRTEGRDAVNAHTTGMRNSIISHIDTAALPTAKLNFLFEWNGDTQRVEMDAGTHVSIPRPDESIVVKFRDTIQQIYVTIEGRADPLKSNHIFVAANATTTGTQVTETRIWLKNILVLLKEKDVTTDASEHLIS